MTLNTQPPFLTSRSIDYEDGVTIICTSWYYQIVDGVVIKQCKLETCPFVLRPVVCGMHMSSTITIDEGESHS